MVMTGWYARLHAICGLIYLWEYDQSIWVYATCAGDEAISGALFVCPSHHQMAPHSNSSLSEPYLFLPALPRLVAS